MKRNLCLESRFARVDLQSINLYIQYSLLCQCVYQTTLSYIGVEGILCLYAIGIQKYMYKLTVHHFVICSINRYILSKTSFQKCVPSALKILRGTSSVIQKQDLLLEYLIEFICDESISIKSMREKSFSLHNTPIFLSIRKGFGPQT